MTILFLQINHFFPSVIFQGVITVLSVAKAAKVSSSDRFGNSWATSAGETATARWPSTTGTAASTAGSKSVWPWGCAVIVSSQSDSQLLNWYPPNLSLNNIFPSVFLFASSIRLTSVKFTGNKDFFLKKHAKLSDKIPSQHVKSPTYFSFFFAT